MADTFLVRTKLQNNPFATEGIPPSPGPPYVELVSALSIMNKTGSNRRLRLKDIQINELVARTSATATNWTIQRLSAMTGGTAVTPTKMDSTSSSLPSQVTVVMRPYTFTAAGGPLRRAFTGPFMSPAVALRGYISRWGSGMGAKSNSTCFSLGDAEEQGYVLREGEGLALLTSNVMGPNYRMQFRVWINVGGATYISTFAATPSAASPVWGVFNGASSGVVLTIGRIEAQEVRSDDRLVAFGIETISQAYGGTDVTPIAMDTTATALSSGVEIKAGAGITQSNIDALQFHRPRGQGDIPYRRDVHASFGISAGLASGLLAFQTRRHQLFKTDNTDVSEILLREGDGIAILQRVNGGGSGEFEISVYLTAEVTGGGGGSIGVSRSRVFAES